MSNLDHTVLITGCTSGIGRATARLLAARGYGVVAGIRSNRPAHEFDDPALPNLKSIELDVTSDDDVARVISHLRETCPAGLAGLVNNAGVGLPAAVELSSLDQMRNVLEVNTLGPLRMIQACLPLLRQGEGRVINISSMNGSIAMPMVGAYSASKFALEALSDSLRIELRPWRIPVSLIRPGQVRTSIFDKARDALAEGRSAIPEELRSAYEPMYDRTAKFNERGAQSRTTPEDVARTVLRAIEARRPRSHYLVGHDARAMQFAAALLPQWLLDHGMARVMHVLKSVD